MMFCCGCLNTEAVLRRLDKKETYDLQEFLGLKVLDGELYKYICWMCYTALKKSIKFKEQCFDARSMYLNMVLVSVKSLHNLYILNFKPNLTQSEVVLINIGTYLETKEDSSLPIIQEIKSEVSDEGTFTNVDDTGSDIKVNLKEEIDLNVDVDILSDININNDSDDSSEDYEIVPEAILFMTNKEANEEICMIEGASVGECALNEVLQKGKQTKLDETTMDRNTLCNPVWRSLTKNNYKASDISFSKKLSVDPNVEISKSKEIVELAVDCCQVNNILAMEPKHSQTKNLLVRNNKTVSNKVCCNKAENETCVQLLSKRVDADAPSTSAEKPYTCDNRGLDKDYLKRYNIMNNQTEEKKYSCNICPYKCVRKSDLESHIRRHTGEKPFRCDICDYRSVHERALIVHMMYKHTKEKYFSCHVCQYKCVTKFNLNVHLRTHTGEKPYECNLCDLKFSQHSSLKKHISNKHTKEKAFICHTCQQNFSSKYNLIVHIRKHTGEKPYTCRICSYKCAHVNTLQSHMKSKHAVK